jgi:hypothetical protein
VDEFERGLAANGLRLCLCLSRRFGLSGRSYGC